MALELSLALEQPSFLQGESIGLELTLQNRGNEPVEIPSVEGNDQIVRFLLRDDSGKELGRYDYRDVQRMLGTSRLHEDRFELSKFPPGGTETVYRDLLRYRSPLRPGNYELIGLYQWEDLSLQTEAQPLQVLPSRPGIIAVGWDNDFGGPHHLLFAWTDHDGEQRLLMDASTFGATHRGRYHTSRAAQVTKVDELQVSRDLGEVAEMQGTLVWKENGRLKWLSLDPGVEFPVHEAQVDLEDWTLLPSPYRESTNTTMVALTNGNGTEVLALALLGDGQTSEIDRKTLPSSPHRHFVHNTDEGPLLIQALDDGAGGARVEAVGLGRSDETKLLEKLEAPVYRLAVLIGETGHPIVAVGILSEDGKRVLTRRWMGPDWRGETGPEFVLPDALPLQLELGAGGSLHVLARGAKGGLLYSNDGEDFKPVACEEMDLERALLVVGRNAIGFLLGPGKSGGVVLDALDAPALPGVLERAGEDADE